MARVLIIAYGNPLRCDDGLAWRAAEELSKQYREEDVQIVTTHQLTPELALPVSQASRVVFIDAAHRGLPGEVSSTRLQPQPQSSVFTHEFSPSAILELSRELYNNCPEASLASICGKSFDHGDTLSPAVVAAIPGLIADVGKLIRTAGASSFGRH